MVAGHFNSISQAPPRGRTRVHVLGCTTHAYTLLGFVRPTRSDEVGGAGLLVRLSGNRYVLAVKQRGIILFLLLFIETCWGAA
ncbi:hypothetical protein XELAEV_18040927mg [Xenopus laevis]|uniref:Uncharacterized protein n=1 Tax=Xenopus laevis TaxID=8355 RepID=A0A974CAE9_XENLA|nr:hypothetical protein XELAEV_18040927mg [Xenopus laevis]